MFFPAVLNTKFANQPIKRKSNSSRVVYYGANPDEIENSSDVWRSFTTIDTYTSTDTPVSRNGNVVCFVAEGADGNAFIKHSAATLKAFNFPLIECDASIMSDPEATFLENYDVYTMKGRKRVLLIPHVNTIVKTKKRFYANK
jgi:hypothetical protein